MRLNTIENSFEPQFNLIDQGLLKKFYNRDMLIGYVEEQYLDFFKKYLPEFLGLKTKKKFFLCAVYDKNQKVSKNYYFKFTKLFYEESVKRSSRGGTYVINSDEAFEYGHSRQLILYAEISLISVDPLTGAQENLSKQKQSYQIGRIPLLVNSKLDRFRKTSIEDPYYFLLNGHGRVLYNTLVRNLNERLLKVNQKIKKLSLTLPEDPETGYKKNLIVYDLKNNLFNLFFFDLKKRINFISLLRILNVSIPELLEEAGEKSIDILSLVSSVYKKSKIELYEEFCNQLTGPNSEELSEPEIKDVVENFLREHLFYSADSYFGLKDQNWMERKKYIALDYFKSFINSDKKGGFLEDHLMFKKVNSLKDHFINCFQSGFTKLMAKAKVLLLKQLGSIKKTKSLTHLLDPLIMRKTFYSYFNKGDIQTNKPYSEFIKATNAYTLLSDQRKIISELSKEVPNVRARSTHPSKPGRICPIQTPHSKAVGFVEYLSLSSALSKRSPIRKIMNSNLFKYLFSLKNPKTGYSVLCNDRLIGYLNKKLVSRFVERLVKFKRKRPYFSFGVDKKNKVLFISFTECRLMKLVYPVEAGVPLVLKLKQKDLSIKEMLKKGFLTYIDAKEEAYANIACDYADLTQQTDYLYINKDAYLSFMCNSIPLASVNATHRYSLSMRLLDQALGRPEKKFNGFYNQKKFQYLVDAHPSVLKTIFEDKFLENLGQNLICAFGQANVEEDAVHLNRSAVQRGLFLHIINKKIEKSFEDIINFTPNSDVLNLILKNPSDVFKDGYLRVGQFMDSKPVLFEQGFTKMEGHLVKSPPSLFNLSKVAYKLEKSTHSCDIKLTFTKVRKPSVGDKIGTRNGLKGVISELTHEYELPFTNTGINAAFIFSNHAIVSRTVIAPLLEIYLSKAIAVAGKSIRTTSFVSSNLIEELKTKAKRVLEEAQMDPAGQEKIYNFALKKFTNRTQGPLKILLLEHHARDKYYLRLNKGGINTLTRQPGDGRSVSGGLRFGQMEVNAAIEHSAMSFLKERLGSDLIKVNICQCGTLMEQPTAQICLTCQKQPICTQVEIPYAFIAFYKSILGLHGQINFNVFRDKENSAALLKNLEPLDKEAIEIAGPDGGSLIESTELQEDT